MIYIETENLILRNFNNHDYDALYLLLSQRKDDIFESYPDITYENTVEHLSYRLNNDEFIAIEFKDTNTVIGNIYLGIRDFNSRELGYIINKDFQRRGYAKEACLIIIKYAFQNGIHRIYSECDPRNISSWKLLESLGFKQEGLLRQNVSFRNDEMNNPIYQDTYIYGLLKSDINF